MKRILAFLVTITVVVVSFVVPYGKANGQDPDTKIAGFNLSLEDNVNIVFYVTSSNVPEGANEGVLVWTERRRSYEEGTENYEITQFIKSGQYKLFFFAELAAKQMTDVVYARSYVEVDGVKYLSDVRNYSILQYIYNKTGRTGTASDNQNLINLLNGMKEYGSLAQIYFKYKTDRLATFDFYQVKVVGGVLDDQCVDGLYLPGEQVELIAPETDNQGQPFSYWEDSYGVCVGTVSPLTITVGEQNQVYTAVFGEPYQTAFTVTFYDYDEVTVLKEEAVERGCDAVGPVAPYRPGYSFSGWSCDFTEVSSDLSVIAQYTKNDLPTLTVKSAEFLGETDVLIEIILDNNPGILGMSFSVEYDSGAMQLVNAANGDATSSLIFDRPGRYKPGCTFLWQGESISSEDVLDGAVLKLTFSVSDSAINGDYGIGITNCDGNVFDNNMAIIELETIDGVLRISR